MSNDILDLKSEALDDAAFKVAQKIEEVPLFYIRTHLVPEDLIQAITKQAKSSFAWECASRGDDESVLILQKKTSCCGMCH